MTVIDRTQDKFGRGEFESSKHAVDQTILRHISVQETREAIQAGQIIGGYPPDKYGPSCLILGFTHAARPHHVQCSHPSRHVIKVITVYEPDPAQWMEFRSRRKKDVNMGTSRETG